jgi:hypothetical protein
MHNRHQSFQFACSALALAALAACGGHDVDAPDASALPATIDISTTVIDGALHNALVCVDDNGNGACDAGEVQGRTDAAGKVTLTIPADRAGKAPLIALVGTDAIDAEHGAVTVPYSLSAPADQPAVLSALTTLVQRSVADAGLSSADAAKALQAALGIAASPFADFTKAPTLAGGGVDPATAARLLVLAAQRQQEALATAVGKPATDGMPITSTDVTRLTERRLLEMLPELAAFLGGSAINDAATPALKAAAIEAAALQLVADKGVSADGAPEAIALGRTPVDSSTPAPADSALLVSLNFSSAGNWFLRLLTASAAQNTPDSNNEVQFIDRRLRASSGQIAKWGAGSDPWREADLHWNGSVWAACALNHPSKSSVRDAKGNGRYDYCDGTDKGRSNRRSQDIGGQRMVDFYKQVRAGGYTNLYVGDTAALDSATFPAGSKVYYQVMMPVDNAVQYQPGGADAPVGASARLTQYSTAVAAGGTAADQPAGQGCNAAETNTSGSNATTLEALIAVKQGRPCLYAQGSFVYNGVTYRGDAVNEWWGNSTVGLGKLGSAPLNSGAEPAYYSGNTLLRAGFAAAGNGVQYYACKERFNNGSPRNCTVIGSGSYTITTLGDARVLTFENLPSQTGPLTFTRVLVERGGSVFAGFRNKPAVGKSARLNLAAANALLAQLGLPAEDPAQPFTLSAMSYQGTWDARDATAQVGASGTTLSISGNGGVNCLDRETNTSTACVLTVVDPASGAFTLTIGSATGQGSLNFLAGTGNGVYHDPTSTPADGSFVATRR